MATLKTFLNKCNFLSTKSSLISCYVQQNGMSQYPSYFVKPVYQKKTQEELQETGEIQKMSHIPTRAAQSDQTCSIYHDPLVSLFTNYVMRDGRKVLARDLVERSFEKIKRVQLEKYHKAQTEEEKLKIELNPRVVFRKAVENCKPLLHLTPVKRGGVTYRVPIPITDKKSQFKSMKWLIEAANDQDRGKKIHFPEKLAYELIDASQNTGRVVKLKQDLHKQCEANKAYAHYRGS